MTVAVAALLALATFGFVGYPLFRQRPYQTAPKARGGQRQTRARREMTDSTLDELEFDHEAGTISDEDFHQMEERYRRQAAPAAASAGSAKPAARRARTAAAQPSSVEDEIEKRVRQLRKSKARFCTECGARIDESDRFCTNCGASVKQ